MKYFLVLFVFIWGNNSHGQNIERLNEQASSIKNPSKKLQLLKENEAQFSVSEPHLLGQYFLLLGLVNEENNLIEDAENSFSQSITILEPIKEKFPNLYVKALIERSYIRYIQTYDIAVYCPDRKKAYEFTNSNITIDMQVRIKVQYAFCFKDNKEEFSTGLSLLDSALEQAKVHHLTPNTHGMIYNASSIIYRQNQLYEQSYQYALEAYSQWAKVNDFQDMFNMLHTLSGSARSLMNYDKAKLHIDEMFTLAKQHPKFKDFTFFANLNAAYLALDQNDVIEGVEYLQKTLLEQGNTKEKFFVKEAYEQLIISYIKLNKSGKARELINEFLVRFPDYAFESPEMIAVGAYLNEQYDKSIEQLFTALRIEKQERLLFLKNTVLATSQLNQENILELDKQLLEKEVEVQRLTISNQKSEQRQYYQLAIFAFVLLIGLSIFSYYLFKTRQYFIFHARTDYLTKAFNRRFMFEQGKRLFKQMKKRNLQMTIMLFDIDYFKSINDTKGHATGDDVINFVVQCCRARLDKSALLGRLGGDEFLIIWPDLSVKDACSIAESIRKDVAHNQLEMIKPLPLSLSIGVVAARQHKSLEETIIAADDLLYLAKEHGKNRVESETT